MIDRQLNPNDEARHVLTGERLTVLKLDETGYRVRGPSGAFHACDGELARSIPTRPAKKAAEGGHRRRGGKVIATTGGRKIRMPAVRT